jgi:hypothetical protein
LDNGDYTALFSEDGWLRVRKPSTEQNYFNLVPFKNEDDTYGVQIDIDNQAGWSFLNNGTLSLPASSNDLYTTTNALIKSIADIQISAGDDVGSNWVFGGNGDLTLPSGGTISEGTVTSNPTIQLTPDNPTVASQKLVIKGGGSYQTDANGISLNLSNITFQVGDAVNAYIYAPAQANQTIYWWIYPEGTGIADPDSITLDNDGYGTVTFELDSDDYEFRIRISPEDNNYDPESIGVESLLINGDAPTFEGDHHLHLTTGDLTVTSIILGTDDHNVRTTTDGKIQITTPSQVNKVWDFDAAGVLTLPAGGDIKYSNGISVIAPQGEYLHEFTGLNTDFTFTNLTFNLLYCQPALGYSGSDTHNVNLPAGTPGQRLVIINTSTNCTLTIDNSKQITATSGPAELIYSGADSEWISLYGLYTGP